MGARLGFFIKAWEKVTADPWVLRTIREGYRLEFTSPPPTGGVFRPTQTPPEAQKAALLRAELQSLLAKKAIVPQHGRVNGLIMSSFFLAPKKGNKWRPIINLRPLNQLIKPKKFRMETLKSILPQLRQGQWATSVDLADAYLHVPVHPLDRRFLSFQLEGETFQFRALPFGLSTAQRVFTRITRVLAAFLRRRGVQIFMYLDDWLIVADDESSALKHTTEVIETARGLGWIINLEKSCLVPSQRPTFLGSVIDFTSGRVFPSEERKVAVLEGARVLLTQTESTARAWLVFLGYLASLVDVVPLCRFRMRDLQLHLLRFFVPATTFPLLSH